MTCGIGTFDPMDVHPKTKSFGSASAGPEESNIVAEYSQLFTFGDHVKLNKENYEELYTLREPLET